MKYPESKIMQSKYSVIFSIIFKPQIILLLFKIHNEVYKINYIFTC